MTDQSFHNKYNIKIALNKQLSYVHSVLQVKPKQSDGEVAFVLSKMC